MVDLFYWDLGTSGIKDMMNRNGFLFFNLACVMFSNLLACVLTFPVMRPIMLKEYQSHTYGITAYFLAQCITDVLIDIFLTLFYVSIVYWAIGLNTTSAWVVIEFYLITFVAFFSGGSMGVMTGCAVDKLELALATTSAIIFPFMYFAGFYRSGNLPESFKWVEYTSNFYYTFQAYMKNQYKDLTITNCYDCPGDLLEGCSTDCDPIKNFDVKFSAEFSILMLTIITLVFRIISYLMLAFSARKVKNG